MLGVEADLYVGSWSEWGADESRPLETGQNLAQEELGAIFGWVGEEVFGRAHFDDLAALHEDDAVGDFTGEAHFVRDDHHGHTGASELLHDVEYFLDHFRVEGRGRLIEQHDPRFHGERTGNRHTLLLTAGKLTGELVGLLRNANTLQQFASELFGFATRLLAHPDRSERDVVTHSQVREQVEALEHHADFGPDLFDVPGVVGELNAVDHDAAALVLFQAVDAPNPRGLTRAGWAEHDDDFAFLDGRGHALEGLEVAVPFVDAVADDHVIARGELSIDGGGCVCVCHEDLPFTDPELLLEALAVLGHGVGANEVDDRDEEQAFFTNAQEFSLVRNHIASDAQEVEDADDCQQRRFLEGSDDLADQRRNRYSQALRKHDEDRALHGGETERIAGLVLATADGLKTTTHVLGQIGGREEHETNRDGRQGRQLHPFGKEQVHEDGEEEQDRDQGNATDRFDVDRRHHAEQRQSTGASQSEQHAEREREDHREDGHVDRDHEAAGEILGRHFDM
ncbi:hypothetical protein GQR58_029853 [Nymphon striatum]|nr:hypothetical protein GQR58_029853 [Nymphon striatum]